MFITLIITSTLAAALFIFPFRNLRETPASRTLLLASALVSWGAVVMWLIVLVEYWQLELATPRVISAEAPVWSRMFLDVLRAAVNLAPVHRWELGGFYALPFLLPPLALVVRRPARAGSWLHRAAIANLTFFWGVLAVSTWIPMSSRRIVALGVAVLAVYAAILGGWGAIFAGNRSQIDWS